MGPRFGIVIVAVMATGCSEWPRYGHLPVEPENLYPSSTDPRTLFPITWQTEQVEEEETNDTPLDSARGAFAMDVGYHIAGSLEGTGWYDNAEPTEITADGCDTGLRSPLGEGDYIGDVDFFRLEVSEAGLLCARAVMAEPTYGWDLVLFPIDDCAIPGAPVADDGGAPVGVDLGGESGGWGVPVEAGDYAIMLAAYYPNDPEAVLAYDLGVALVHPDPSGGAPLCPLLPDEAPASETE